MPDKIMREEMHLNQKGSRDRERIKVEAKIDFLVKEIGTDRVIPKQRKILQTEMRMDGVMVYPHKVQGRILFALI